MAVIHLFFLFRGGLLIRVPPFRGGLKRGSLGKQNSRWILKGISYETARASAVGNFYSSVASAFSFIIIVIIDSPSKGILIACAAPNDNSN